MSRYQVFSLIGLGCLSEAGFLGLIGLGNLTQWAGQYVALCWGIFGVFGIASWLILRRPKQTGKPYANQKPATEVKPASADRLGSTLLVILFFAGLFRLTLVLAAPTLSTDQFRYTWEGHLVLEGVSPYRYAPNDPALVPYHSPIWPLVQQPASTSPYPPLSQLIGAAEYLLFQDSLLGPKIAAAFFDFLNCLALVWLLGRLRFDRRKVILYAWCPLPIIEFSQSGHNDAPMLFLLLIAIGLALSKRPGLSALTLGLATLAKFTALFGLPLFLVVWADAATRPDTGWSKWLHRRGWPYALLTVAVVGLGYLPFLLIGQGAIGSLLEYTGSWRDNESVLINLVGDVFGLAVAKGLSLAILAVVVGLLTFHPRLARQLSLARRLTLVLGTTLLVATTVHTWYVSWILVLLPLVFGEDEGWGWDIGWLLFAALAQLPYLTYKFYGVTTLYQWIRPLEYYPVLLLVAWNGWYIWHKQRRQIKPATPIGWATAPDQIQD